NVTDFDIAKLEELYVEFHKLAEADESLEEKAREWFKKLEEGDAEAKSIWQKCVDASMEEFDRVYKLLGVKIDFAFGESYYESEMKQIMEDASVKKHLSKGEDGASIIDLSKEGISTPLMFLKSDGATTYATRDLATIKFRERKWDPDIIIYEVGAEQSLHFKQVFAAARLLGLVKNSVELVHTAHGLYLAPDGKKFSTRAGKTIKLEEVLDEAVKRAKKLGNSNEKVAKEVGIGAIKYFDLMHSVQSNVVFEWDKIMNMEGNSGPYLQYTVARCNSVLLKSANKQITKYANKLENEELSVLRSLVRFSEVIVNAAKTYSPNLLCNYLYDLAQKYNGFYNTNRIIDSDNEEFRLALTFGVGQVLKNGLRFLGIETPERM
ncbi:MAG: arginine--tRNA ligase, partial [Candidatus Woesebacteria bacterium]|nr:arginine--tRNA ligase [Candidatus Woesebacteria bacterium]